MIHKKEVITQIFDNDLKRLSYLSNDKRYYFLGILIYRHTEDFKESKKDDKTNKLGF